MKLKFAINGLLIAVLYNLGEIIILTPLIKTHDSESRGQEEAGRMQRMSVLFTGSTGVKFVNALNKPPLKLSFSYQGLS